MSMTPRKRAGGAELEEGEVARQHLPKKPNSSSERGNGKMTDSMESVRNGSSSTEMDALYGRETKRQLSKSNVLISGMQGLGAEIAKNLVLAGVKSLTLHDEGDVELWDLSSNFFFFENDVGKNRADASAQKLQGLDNAVAISTLTENFSKEYLSNFQAVVFTEISLEKAIEYDEYCHHHQPPIPFIKSETRGLFGTVFCDFGPEFTVVDDDCEKPHTGIIASISNGNPALVCYVDEEQLEFQDGDVVIFSEVQGMEELNDGKPRKVINVSPYSFSIDEDTSQFGPYEKGGIVIQVKEPKVLHFRPLRDALRDPGNFLLSGFTTFDHPCLLHLAFQALDKFKHDMGRFPVAGSEEDALVLIEFVVSMNESLAEGKLKKIDKKVLRHFANGSRAILNPMAAMFGGIVGQEVLKACTGKFYPFLQFFYFDSVESLPVEPLDPDDVKPLNCRYDAQISVFGSKLQKKMEEAKIFVVGSGARGCEFLKNLALMGVCCNQKGKLTITDGDLIEKSNLTRQFLCRDSDIGLPKSTVAASVAISINPSFHIEPLLDIVAPETENMFCDEFWESLDVVISAVDTVEARMYLDLRCLYFQKPFLESETLGTQCNTQVVVPHLSETYGATIDALAKQAPICTVRSFPYKIDHCLIWARSEFEGLLETIPIEVNKFLTNPSEYASSMKQAGNAQAKDLLEHVVVCLTEERCQTFEDCVHWARLRFEDYFSNRVKQLTFTFPDDSVTSTGAPFWSAPKRYPRPLEFSTDNLGHLHFLMYATILRAETFQISVPAWAKNFQKLGDAVEKVIVPEFQPRKGAKVDEKATTQSATSADDAVDITNLITKLEECAKKLPPGFLLHPMEFDKNDGRNHHMDLIVGLANMRARNYSIPEVDKVKARLILESVIPVFATSTAMATGLVCLELYKVLSGRHKVSDYRNTYADLALPSFSTEEPVRPGAVKHQDMEWTVWDRWVVEGNVTIMEFLQWMKDRGLNVYSIACGDASEIYHKKISKHQDRLKRKVVDVVKEVAQIELPAYRSHVDVLVLCDDDALNKVEIPLVSVYFGQLEQGIPQA